MAIAGHAQKVRKTWDFRNGFSGATITNLNADMQQNGATGNESHWRNYEKDATKPSDGSFWCSDNGTTTNDDGFGVTVVDGRKIVIPELEGLKIAGIKAKGFVINYNYAQSADDASPSGLYPYGKSFLWLNGKSLKMSFTARKGETVRMGVESHKVTEARGLNLVVDGQTVAPDEGNNTPTHYEDVTWTLPDNTPGVDDDCTVDIVSTNGCHIYYIIVGAGDDPEANLKKVAYVHGGTTDGDLAYQTISASASNKVTAIDATTTTLTRDDLTAYDVTVIAPTLAADNTNVEVLKEALPWTPVLNFNASLYDAWGYGEAVATTDAFGITGTPGSDLYARMTLINGEDAGLEAGQSGIVFTNEKPITAVRLGDYFAHDDILATPATEPSLVAIHAHNIYHNGYIYLPYNAEALADAYNEGDATATLIANAVNMLASSKSEITSTPAPTVSLAYGNFKTTVTLQDARPEAAIHYTLNGDEPTVASPRYVEPFTVEAQTRVRAIAVAEGYTPSAVTDSTVNIYEQAKTPALSIEEADDQSTLTLTCETPESQIWYNFAGASDTLQSTRYDGPFVIRDHATVTAFATSASYVQSEPLTREVFVRNDKVYIDEASHFDANYGSDKSNGAGLFAWGKNAEQDSIQTENVVGTYVDADGVEQPIYEKVARETAVYPEGDAAWVVKSNGQSVLWQNITPGTTPGDGTGYNPATAADLDTLITKNDVQFYKFQSGQYNARIETTQKFRGPFNVVAFLGNASATGSVQKLAVEVSADGEAWSQVGDTLVVANPQRLWNKFTVPYDDTQEVFVRLAHVAGNSGAQCYDIYIMTEGEKSLALEKELAEGYQQQATGIAEVGRTRATAVPQAIYTVNGTRVARMQRGINIVRMSDGTTRKVLVK